MKLADYCLWWIDPKIKIVHMELAITNLYMQHRLPLPLPATIRTIVFVCMQVCYIFTLCTPTSAPNLPLCLLELNPRLWEPYLSLDFQTEQTRRIHLGCPKTNMPEKNMFFPMFRCSNGWEYPCSIALPKVVFYLLLWTPVFNQCWRLSSNIDSGYQQSLYNSP